MERRLEGWSRAVEPPGASFETPRSAAPQDEGSTESLTMGGKGKV